MEFLLKLVLDALKLLLGKWEQLALPLPIEISLTPVLLRLTVEKAPSTYLIIDNGHWLKSVRENDIWVHGSHINVVNQRFALKTGALGLEGFEL